MIEDQGALKLWQRRSALLLLRLAEGWHEVVHAQDPLYARVLQYTVIQLQHFKADHNVVAQVWQLLQQTVRILDTSHTGPKLGMQGSS